MEKYINQIINGDCLAVMKELPDKCIDLVLTDPPYAIHAKSGGGLHNKRDWLKNVHEANLDAFNPTVFLEEIQRINKNFHAYVFCSKNLLKEYIAWIETQNYNWDLLIMAKQNPIPTKNNKYLSDKEYILYIRDKGCYFNNNAPYSFYYSVKKINVLPSQFGHPTEKQTSLIQELLEISTKENDLVLDCFLGSGTTAVACKATNRRFIGVEINEKYCEIARKRVENQASPMF